MSDYRVLNSRLKSPLDTLYTVCFVCNGHLPWRKVEKNGKLLGSCCGLVFSATPLFNAQKFHIVYSKADMTNVRILSRVT